MMVKQRFSFREHRSVFIITFLLCSSYLFASEQEPLRYKIFSLSKISAERGKKFLSEAKVGTVSSFPGSDALLITAPASELTKAMAILKLVDTKEQFAVKAIVPDGGIENLPSNRQIAEAVGNISIGTFSQPPSDTAPARAIVDMHKDAVVVVAPQSLFARIVFAIEGKPIVGEVHDEKTEQREKVDMLAPVPAEPGAFEPTVPARRYEPEPIPDGEQVVKLNLPQKVTIVDLLGLVGKHLQLDFLYDPTKVIGDVTLMINGEFRGPMKVKDLYPLLESVLKFRGFVMSRGPGNLVKIVPEAEAYDIDPTLIQADKGKVEHGDVAVSRVFQLQHIDTTSAQNFLATMKLATNVNPVPKAGTLVITDYAYRMPRIEELLRIIDKPGEPKQFRFRQLKYTMAKMLAPQVKALAEELGTVSVTITESAPPPAPVRARRPPRRAPAQPPTQTPELSKPTVYLDADERTNRVLMIGIETQLDIVESLIDSLDVEQQDLRTLQLYKIKHVDAEEARNKLQELGIIGGGQTTTSGRITPTARSARTPAARPSAGGTAVASTDAEALMGEPQVVVIEPTNSLLVNATAEQHDQISQVLGYVDREQEQAAIPYVVYPLENQDPMELADVLNRLITVTVTSQDKEAKIQTTTKRIEEDIFIVPDAKTYSLIVYANKKNQTWISALIEQLDEYRPQVLLDVTLVEVTKNDEFNYDLNLINSLPNLINTSGLTGTIIGGDNPILSSDIISALGSSKMDRFIDMQSNGGSGTGFYGDRHINVLLTAMQKKNYGRILAKPKLLVKDGEEGTITADETTYVVRSEVSVVPTGTGTSTTVEKDVHDAYQAGITLGLKPHISKGNQIGLEVSLVRSDFRITQEVLDTGKPPDTVKSDVSTKVTVPDGTTIILGGLERLSQSKGGTKVPIIGDIPLIGGLFRSTANTNTQSRLYVFVKAHILRPGAEGGESAIVAVSRQNRATFEEYEEEMQKYEDWPGIKPKPMDPVRILEED